MCDCRLQNVQQILEIWAKYGQIYMLEFSNWPPFRLSNKSLGSTFVWWLGWQYGRKCTAWQIRGIFFLSEKSGTSEVIRFRDKDLFVQFLLIAQLQQVQHCCCTKTSSFFGIFPASRNHQSEWSWPSLKIQKVELAFNSCHWSLSQRYFWPVIWECLLAGWWSEMKYGEGKDLIKCPPQYMEDLTRHLESVEENSRRYISISISIRISISISVCITT